MAQKVHSEMSNECIFEQYTLKNDTQYLDKIALQNKPYIKTIAKQLALKQTSFLHSIIELEDLEQEGFLGFKEGLVRYKVDSGKKLVTYCGYWAKKRMNEHLASFENTVYHPDWIRRWALYGNVSKFVNQTEYQKMVVEGYKSNIIKLPNDNDETIDNETDSKIKHFLVEEKQFDFDIAFCNVEYDYLRLIVSKFNQQEKDIINNIWEDPNKAFKANKITLELFSKIKNIYETLKKQAHFASVLENMGECLLSNETYEFWSNNGVCGDKKYKYEAKDIFKIEKIRLDIRVSRISNSLILLETYN